MVTHDPVTEMDIGQAYNSETELCSTEPVRDASQTSQRWNALGQEWMSGSTLPDRWEY